MPFDYFLRVELSHFLTRGFETGGALNNLHVIARFRCIRGKEAELRSVLLGLIAPTRREQGCIRYDLLENPDDPRELVFIEEWTDGAALDAHLQTDHIAAAKARFPELLEKDLELSRLQQIG